MEDIQSAFNNLRNEIIAIGFDGLTLFGPEALKKLKNLKYYTQLFSRAQIRLMSSLSPRLDLDEKGGKYAEEAPTLFFLKEGTPLEIAIANNNVPLEKLNKYIKINNKETI